MSRIEYTACDKCGKKIREIDGYSASLYVQTQYRGTGQNNKSYDLCERCLAKFKDWMKDNESEINN